MADFDKAFVDLMVDEVGGAPNGGYTNDPTDRGCETKYGISKRAYPNEDIKNLTSNQAAFFYKRDYWDRVFGDAIQVQSVASAVLDTCVNFGLTGGGKLVQHAARVVPADGKIGPKTIQFINAMRADDFLNRLALIKIGKAAAICSKDPDQKKFLMGWLRRALKDCGIDGVCA